MVIKVLQRLLHLPQLLPRLWTFAALSAKQKANPTWGMHSKKCKTGNLKVAFLRLLLSYFATSLRRDQVASAARQQVQEIVMDDPGALLPESRVQEC